MPQIVGRKVAPNDGQTIADSLRSLGDSMYRPIDPVSQEKIKQLQAQSAARTNMIAALQRGDLIEYGAQGLQAGVPIDDAQGYARQAGLIDANWQPVTPLGRPVLWTGLNTATNTPQYNLPQAVGSSPQPPAPMATGTNTTTPQFAPQTNASSPWS